jgi:hypothetical protein
MFGVGNEQPLLCALTELAKSNEKISAVLIALPSICLILLRHVANAFEKARPAKWEVADVAGAHKAIMHKR